MEKAPRNKVEGTKLITVMNFRCTQNEKALITFLALRAGLPRAQLIKLLLRKEAERQGIDQLGMFELEPLRKGGKS